MHVKVLPSGMGGRRTAHGHLCIAPRVPPNDKLTSDHTVLHLKYRLLSVNRAMSDVEPSTKDPKDTDETPETAGLSAKVNWKRGW